MIIIVMMMMVMTTWVVQGHERTFPNHPEWNNIWPDPFTLNDLKASPEIDRSGIYEGGILVTPSSGGYGSEKGRYDEVERRPGASYSVRCLQSKCGSHGWVRALILVRAGDSIVEFFDKNKRLHRETFVVNSNGDLKFTKSGNVWRRFRGDLSGLWIENESKRIVAIGHDKNNLRFWAEDLNSSFWHMGFGKIEQEIIVFKSHDHHKAQLRVSENNLVLVDSSKKLTRKSSRWLWPNRDIKKVHMVFMNHLDIGYTSSINVVLNEYLHQYLPQIGILGKAFENSTVNNFKYITHPWLMSLLFECPCPNSTCLARTLNNSRASPLQCSNSTEIENFKEAVNSDYMYWHAFPFNSQLENMSPTLFETGLKMARAYDHEFNRTTRTVSIRDVMYVTRSILPYLNKYGVQALTIGSNGADYPTQVPKLHVWKGPENSSVIVMYHPFGYGGYSKSTCAGPGQCGDCAEAPNGVALCTEFRTDNTGPPASPDEVIKSLNAVREEYPSAKVIASTFDAFLEDVEPVRDQLPVVTGEVGDTWIYGVPSDPLKVAQNRVLQRVLEECIANESPEMKGEKSCKWEESKAIQNFTRFLHKAPEHTYGTPGIGGWGAGNDYNRTSFYKNLTNDNYMAASSSWAEQRIYNELALLALEEANHPLAKEARIQFDNLASVSAPDVQHFDKLNGENMTSLISLSSNFDIQFNSAGAIVSLRKHNSTRNWASETSRIAELTYQTFNESDWVPFTYDYINGHGESGGFCKKGSNNFTVSAHFHPTLQNVYVSETSAIAHVIFPDDAVSKYGASFREAYINVSLSSESSRSSNEINLEVVAMEKMPTMIGESTMLTFTPAGTLKGFTIDKLGYDVNPEDVIAGGNQMNHVAWNGGTTATTTGGDTIQIVSLDASNFCPATKSFPYGNPLPAGSNGLMPLQSGSVLGMGVNIHNNLWNTNYPLYYPYFDPKYCTTPFDCVNANAKFRFVIRVSN